MKDENLILISSSSKPIHCGSAPGRIYSEFFRTDLRAKEYWKHVKYFYSSLKPVELISNAVNNSWIDNNAKEGTTLGLHIRRTDMLNHLIDNGITPPNDEDVIKLVDQYLIDNPEIEKIYLACDNETSEDKFKQHYGGLIFSYENNWISENLLKANSTSHQARLTSMKDSTIDLFSLSKCNFIIGTKHSSFSTFAAALSGIDYLRV
jgi:effector-binding domain-containing protein